MVDMALKAAEMLAGEGLEAEVIDLRTIVPLDKQTVINSLKKTQRIAIVQEAVSRCGFASELGMIIMEEAMDYLDAPVKRIAAANTPVAFAPVLEDFIIPNPDTIYKEVRSMF
jgi:pyruvate dehydrogenase E1 component beta subunit